MEPLTCIDCGFILGAYYEAFVYMREVYLVNKTNDIHIDKKFIDPETQENLIPIFKALNINKYCCRSQLTTCKNMHELGY